MRVCEDLSYLTFTVKHRSFKNALWTFSRPPTKCCKKILQGSTVLQSVFPTRACLVVQFGHVAMTTRQGCTYPCLHNAVMRFLHISKQGFHSQAEKNFDAFSLSYLCFQILLLTSIPNICSHFTAFQRNICNHLLFCVCSYKYC